MKKMIYMAFILAMGSANGSLEKIDVFQGQWQEGWEGIDKKVEGDLSIFGEQGIFRSTSPYYGYATEQSFSFGSAGRPKPIEGSVFLGVNGDGNQSTFTFNQPVTRFGGYWAFTSCCASAPYITFEAYTASGELIDTLTYRHDEKKFGAMMQWVGFESSKAMGSVVLKSDFFVADALQIAP
ncbi:hypothetical protein L4174_007020 [Photobacterium sp. CCB-ST2H9]|uniref:hypothetical protein n=1 Tax=Photobacterium sp. CCB-ST2H9 TaxID=2912855 RepID=UPI0020063FAE|nr:hypothetical protein [Photobacterium sp. CCB-ST2H9]UTM58579.1 hypothetical protein L4174_007020 [Photobacterium sp. CCB-ST2H9]